MAKPPKQGAVAHAVGTKPGRKSSLPSLLRQTKGSGTGAARLIPFKQRTHVTPKLDVPLPFTTLLADQRGGFDQISDLTDPPIIYSVAPPIEEILPSQQSATSSLSQSSRDAHQISNVVPSDATVWGKGKKVNVSTIGKSEQTLLSTLDVPRVPKTPKTSSEKKTMSLTGRVSVLTPSPVTLSRVVVQQPLQTLQPRGSSQQLQEQREAMKSPVTDAAIHDVEVPSPTALQNRNELQHQLSPQTDASVVMSISASENETPLRALDNTSLDTAGTMKAIQAGEKLPGGHQVGKKVAFSKVKALLSRVGKKQQPSEPLIVEQAKSVAVKVSGIPVVPSYEPHVESIAQQLESAKKEDIPPDHVISKQPVLKVKAVSPEVLRYGPPSLERARLSIESMSPIHSHQRHGSPERASRLPPNPESPIRILRLQPQTESPEYDENSTFQNESPERRLKTKMRSPRSRRGLDPDDDTSPTKPERVPVDAPEVVVNLDEEECAEMKAMERDQTEAVLNDDMGVRSSNPPQSVTIVESSLLDNVENERREVSLGPASDLMSSMNVDPCFHEVDDDEKSHLSVQGIPVFYSFSGEEVALDDDDEEIVDDDETELQIDLEHNPFVDRVTADEVLRKGKHASVESSQLKICSNLSLNTKNKLSFGGTSVKTGPAEYDKHNLNPNIQPNTTVPSTKMSGNPFASSCSNDEDDEEEIDVFEAVAFSGRHAMKSTNPFDEGSNEEGIPIPKSMRKEALLISALKGKSLVQKKIRTELSVGPLADGTGSKQNLKKKAESKASKHRTAQETVAKISSSGLKSLTFPRDEGMTNPIKVSTFAENKPLTGLPLLPDEVMMDESGTISDLDQSLRHFPLRLVEASDRSIDVSGLGHTRDAEETITITTRTSFEEVIDRYTVSPTQELLRLRTKGVNFAEDGKKSPALADSITESDNTPPPSSVSVPDAPPGLFNSCEQSFMAQAWIPRFLARSNEKPVVTGNVQTKEDIKPAPEVDMTTHEAEVSIAEPCKETVSIKVNNSASVSFLVEAKVNHIASTSSEDDSENTLPAKESLGASSRRSHYEETPRISNEASRAPDADGVFVEGGSIVGVRSSESSKVANYQNGALEPTTLRASRDTGRRFFEDQDVAGDFMIAQDMPYGGLPAIFSAGKMNEIKLSMVSPSSDIEAVFDKYHAIEDDPPVGRLVTDTSGLKRVMSPATSGEISTSNADSIHLLQTTSHSSFLERLFTFGQEAIGMNDESKHVLQCRMQRMSPASKSLLEKAIQKAEIELALTDRRHVLQKFPEIATTPTKSSALIETERVLNCALSTRTEVNKLPLSSNRGIASTKSIQHKDRVLQLKSPGSQLFPGWSTSLGGSQSHEGNGTGVSSFRWREGVLSTGTHESIVHDIHSSFVDIKLPAESGESPSDEETWYSLRDEWKHLNRELEGGMKIMSNKSRDIIETLLNEAAGETETEMQEKGPLVKWSDDDVESNLKFIARQESLLGYLVSEELIDLTAIASYEDLQDEEAMWLFDLDNGMNAARLGQNILSCSHLENLMEFAAEKLNLLPSTVVQLVGQELKNEISCNEASTDHAMSPFLTVKSSVGRNSLRKIETASDIGNLEQEFLTSSKIKTPMADSIGDLCQVSPSEGSRHEDEGLPETKPNATNSAHNTEEATFQIGEGDVELETPLDDLLNEKADQVACNQLGYEIVPVGAEAIMVASGKSTTRDPPAIREYAVSPSSAAADRYDSIGAPPDKYDTIDDAMHRPGSDDEFSEDGSSVSSNDGFATILEKVKRDLGESTMRVIKPIPVPENQILIQTSRQPRDQASSVSEIAPRRDFLDILFDGTLICGTDKQIEVVHSAENVNERDQCTDDSQSISFSLNANPLSYSLNGASRKQPERKNKHSSANVNEDEYSAPPQVECHELSDAREGSESDNRALFIANSTEHHVVPSTPGEDLVSSSPFEYIVGQKEDLHDRVSQICNTISDSNPEGGNEKLSCHTEVLSPSPRSRARVSLGPLVESHLKVGLRHRVNQLCNTISDSTTASARMTEKQPTDKLGANSFEQSIKPIIDAVAMKEIQQLEASNFMGDARDDDSTTGIVMSNDDIISPYVTDVVKDVLFSLGSDLSAKSARSTTMAFLGEGNGNDDGSIIRDHTIESIIVSGSERASQPKRAPKPEDFMSHIANQRQPSGETNSFLHSTLSHGKNATDTSKSTVRVAPKPEDFFDRESRPPDVLCIDLMKQRSSRESFHFDTGDKIETLRIDDNERRKLVTKSPIITREPFDAEAHETLNEVESLSFAHTEILKQGISLSDDKTLASELDRPSSTDKEFTGKIVTMLLSDGQDETTVGPSATLMFSEDPVDGIGRNTSHQPDNVPLSVTLLNENGRDVVTMSKSGSEGPAVPERNDLTADAGSNELVFTDRFDEFTLNSKILTGLSSMHANTTMDRETTFGNVSTVFGVASYDDSPIGSDSSENMQLSGSNAILSEVSTLNSQAFAGLTDLLEKLSTDRTNDSVESQLQSSKSSETRENSGSTHQPYASRNLDSNVFFHAHGSSGHQASPVDSIAISDDTSRRSIDDVKQSNTQGTQHQKNIPTSATRQANTSQEEIMVPDYVEEDNIVFPEAFAVLSPRQSYSGDLFEVTESILGQNLESPMMYHSKLSMHGLSTVSSQEFPAALTMKVTTNRGKNENLLHLLGSRPETPIVIHDAEKMDIGFDYHPSPLTTFHSDVRRSRNISVPEVQLSLSPQIKHFDFSERNRELSVRGTPLVLGLDVNLDEHTEVKRTSIIANHGQTVKTGKDEKTVNCFYGTPAGYDEVHEEQPYHHTATPSTDTVITANPSVRVDEKSDMEFGDALQSDVESSETVSWIAVVPGGNFLSWNNSIHLSGTTPTHLESIAIVAESDDRALAWYAEHATARLAQAPLFSRPETEAYAKYRDGDNVSSVQMSHMDPSSTTREQSRDVSVKTPGDDSKDPIVLQAIDKQIENAGIVHLVNFSKPVEGMSTAKKNGGEHNNYDGPSNDQTFARDASRKNSNGASTHISNVTEVERNTAEGVDCSFASVDPDVIIIESSSRSTTAFSLAKQTRVVKLSTLGSTSSVATESMIESDSKSICGSKVSNSIPREISVTTRLVYGIEVEKCDPTTPAPDIYLDANKQNAPTPTAIGLVPNILASLGLSRGSDWSECNPITSLAEVLVDGHEIDDWYESTSLLLALTRSETSDSATTHCSSYDENQFALRDARSSHVESSGLKVSQLGYRCKIDRLRGIAKEASKVLEVKNNGAVQHRLFEDASEPISQKALSGSPLLKSLLRRLSKQGSDSQSSREADVQQETAIIPPVPLPQCDAEKVKQGDIQIKVCEAHQGSLSSRDGTVASSEDEEREVFDSIDIDGAISNIPYSVEVHSMTGLTMESKINAEALAKTLNRDEGHETFSGDSEVPAITLHVASVRRSSPEDQHHPQSVEILNPTQRPKSLPQLSNVMDRLRIISEKSDSFSFTSSDVEPLDVEELFHRYDNIVKHMVVLDESKLARVQSKQKESSPVTSGDDEHAMKSRTLTGSTFPLANGSRSPTSRLAALTVDTPDVNLRTKQHSRRTSLDSHISSYHNMIVSPGSDETRNEEFLTSTENNPHEQQGRGQRLNRLKLQKSQSTDSAQVRSSASAASSHLSQKARNLRKQLENALQQSAVIRNSQEKLGKEITSFKQKIHDRRAASPQPQRRSSQPTAAERTSPVSSPTKSIGSYQSRPDAVLSMSNEATVAGEDTNAIDFQSATITKAIQHLTLESSDISVCLTEKSPIERIRHRHSRHVRDSPTSQRQQRSIASPSSSTKTPDLIQVPSSIVTISSSKLTTKTQVDNKESVEYVQNENEDTEMQYSDDEGEDHVVQLQQIESIVSGLFRTESTNSMAAADKPKLREKLASPRLKRIKSKSPSCRHGKKGFSSLSVCT